MRRNEFLKMYELENVHFWFIGKRLCIDAVLKENIKKTNTILDIGCGTGGTTYFLQKYGKVVGLESNKYACELAKKRLPSITRGDAHMLPYKNESFDMVTLIDVLYHRDISNISRVLQEVKRVLKPKGKLLITDSAFPLLWSSHDEAMYGRRRFTISELRLLLERENYSLIRSTYFFFFIFPITYIKRKIVDVILGKKQSDVQKIHPLFNSIGIVLMKIESWMLQYLSFPYGSSLVIYAQKN